MSEAKLQVNKLSCVCLCVFEILALLFKLPARATLFAIATLCTGLSHFTLTARTFTFAGPISWAISCFVFFDTFLSPLPFVRRSPVGRWAGLRGSTVTKATFLGTSFQRVLCTVSCWHWIKRLQLEAKHCKLFFFGTHKTQPKRSPLTPLYPSMFHLCVLCYFC